MNLGKEKIKDFVEKKADQVAGKIEETPQQKMFVFFLVVISLTAVVLGYLQFKKTLDEPFLSEYINIRRAELEKKYNPEAAASSEVTEQERIISLQNKDSDLDGLTDYSEIYVYQTNAYLEDTDFDGITDKNEIVQGTDPTCAEGEDCGIGESRIEPETTQSNLSTGSSLGDINIGTSDPQELRALQERVFSGEISLDELGIDNPALQQFLKLYQNAVQGDTTGLSDENKKDIKSELSGMSADEIRQQLIIQGIDPALLSQIDDQTLVETFSQVLQGF